MTAAVTAAVTSGQVLQAWVAVTEVSVRDLRNRGGQVLDRVARGERITITRDGRPVAELRPYVPARVSAEALLRRWRHLPQIDPDALRADLDDVMSSAI